MKQGKHKDHKTQSSCAFKRCQKINGKRWLPVNRKPLIRSLEAQQYRQVIICPVQRSSGAVCDNWGKIGGMFVFINKLQWDFDG